MNSREIILQSVAAAQPDALIFPEVHIQHEAKDVVSKFSEVLHAIGGTVLQIKEGNDLTQVIGKLYSEAKKVIDLRQGASGLDTADFDAHSLEDVDLTIIEANLGVAENGAIWLTDQEVIQRVLPFITQNLVMFLPKSAIVPTMHEAYRMINDQDYGFGVFIAGPSKTADIEQSLVIGAHGSKSMTVLLIDC